MHDVNRILIVGTLPETSGIGGVTIHVRRLLDYFNQRGIKYSFVDYRQDKLVAILWKLHKFEFVHFHISNKSLLLIFVLICRFFLVKPIITIHGNLGGKNKRINFIANLAVRLCYIPIVLNEDSLQKAKSINKRAVLIPAFIPPIKDEILQDEIINNINEFKSNISSFLFATNAYALSFDKDNKEIYGITDLIGLFKKNPEFGLIFSDPSSTYTEWLKDNHIDIPENIIIINGNHSFYEIIKKVDALIRNTSTDGDSLSIKEALFLKKPVLCTNVVSRHPLCITYKFGDMCELEKLMKTTIGKPVLSDTIVNGAEFIEKLYLSLSI